MRFKHVTAAAMLALMVAVNPQSLWAGAKTINVTKNALHRDFFTVPVSIIPRAGFSFKKTDAGIADTAKKICLDGSVINLSYDKFLDELTSGSAGKGKIDIKSRSSFIWNGDRAELLKIFQPGAGVTMGKWVLIIDRGENVCWMITGAYNSADAKASEAVLAMMTSAYWPERETAEEETALPLPGNIDTSRTPFKIAGFRQGSLVYTKDGAIPTKDADQALFVLSRLQSDYIIGDKRIEFANAKINTIERGAKLDIISQTKETVGDIPAVITVAYTADKEPALIYQAALFKNSGVVLMVGIARKNTAKNLDIFHQLTASFKEN